MTSALSRDLSYERKRKYRAETETVQDNLPTRQLTVLWADLRIDSLPSAEMCTISMCCLHSECVLSASDMEYMYNFKAALKAQPRKRSRPR